MAGWDGLEGKEGGSYVSALDGPVHAHGAGDLEGGGGGALATLGGEGLGEVLLFDLVDGGFVQEDVDGAEVHV